MFPITGQKSDCHELSHGSFGNATENKHNEMAHGIAWHMKHFAYLLGRFKDTPEGNGKMIDNIVALMLHEGGHGFDPSSGLNDMPHSTENMACLIAGRVGGLKAGQHVRATGKHPANVVLTALQAVGYSGNTLGEVTGPIADLL